MGSTTKIIFSSLLAISIVLMFLIFSMQKSAQLTLDIQDVEHTVQVKDEIIANIQQKLKKTEAIAEHATTQNAQIPKLQSNIDSIEKEKAELIGQIEELQNTLQAQLEKAADNLAQFLQLKQNFKEQKSLLTETEKAKISAEMLTSQTAEELEAMQGLLVQRDEELNQFLINLDQKDQAITFYQEKIETAIEEIATIKAEQSTSRINLALVLDELANKTQAVANLTDRVEELTGSKTYAGEGRSYPKQKTISAASEIKTLLDRTDQESTSPEEELIASAMAEIEDLQTTNGLLRSGLNEQSALIEDLQTTLQEKENEITDTIKQGHEIVVPLTERITLLEFQLEEAININSTVSDELSSSQTKNAELGNKNNSLTTDLESTHSTLEEALKQVALLNDSLGTAEEALQQEENSRLSLTQEMEAVTLALSEVENQYNTRNSQYGELETELASSNAEHGQLTEQVNALQEQLTQQGEVMEEAVTLRQEIERFTEIVAEKDMAIENLTSQLAGNSEQLSSLQADLDQARTQEEARQSDTQEQEERVSRLIEEVAATKAFSEEQTLKLQSTEEQLAALGEKAAEAASLEEKVLSLETTLAENQEKTNELQSAITSLTEERDQLLSGTMDNGDAPPEAGETPPDTVEDSAVNAEESEPSTASPEVTE